MWGLFAQQFHQPDESRGNKMLADICNELVDEFAVDVDGHCEKAVEEGIEQLS